MCRRVFPALIAVLAVMASGSAPMAAALPVSEPALCVEAARNAARRHGIPVRMMHAITLVETRRRIGGETRPWPWTLNIEGEGHWFGTRAEALGRALREIGRGRRSIDLGCFQLNWRWHGENFATPDGMLDPESSADYAARFLAALYAETGDWMRAAGHYHSRTPEHAARYRALVDRTLARLRPELASAPEPPARPVAEAETPLALVSAPGAVGSAGIWTAGTSAAGNRPLIRIAAGPQHEAAAPRAAGGVVLSALSRAARPWFAGVSP